MREHGVTCHAGQSRTDEDADHANAPPHTEKLSCGTCNCKCGVKKTLTGRYDNVLIVPTRTDWEHTTTGIIIIIVPMTTIIVTNLTQSNGQQQHLTFDSSSRMHSRNGED
jgi:hypothetical protein